MNIEKKSPLLLAAIYFVVGAVWVMVTDRMFPCFSSISDELMPLSTCKGLFFVGMTSVLFYGLLRIHGRKLLAFRDEADEKLRRSEANLKTVIENLPFDFWISDRDGVCLMQNSVSVRNWGSCVGKSFDELSLPKEVAEHWREIHRRTQNGEVVMEDAAYQVNGRRDFRYEIVSPVRDRDAIWGTTGVSIDITQLKRAEAALLESEMRYRRLFEDAVLGIFQFSPEGKIIVVNPAFARMFGYDSPGELLANVVNAADVYAAPSRQDWVVRIILEDTESVKIENDFRRRDGSVFTGNLAVWKVRGADGKILCLEGFIEDVSERKRAEQAIRQSEEKFRTIFENAPVMISSFDRDGRCLLWNRECEKNLGWSRELVQDSADPLRLFFPDPEQRDRVLANIMRADGTFSESRVLAGNGEARTQLWANFCLPDGSLISVGHDITSRKQTVKALQRERALLRSLIDSIPDLIFYKNNTGNYIGCNKAFEKFAGMPESDLIGKTDQELFPADMAQMFREMDAMMLKAGIARRNEEWVVYPDGRQCLLDTLKTPFFDENANTLGLIGISRDITDQKRAEEEKVKLESQLYHAQKMEAVGQLAGGVAHDFNNILTAIKGYAYLLQAKVEDARMLHFIEQLDRAVDKATSLTNSLLAFSRKRVICLKPVNINETIVRSQKLLSRLINEDIEIRTELTDESLTVLGDESHIEQVVMNLVTNARDAMPMGGTLTISTEHYKMNREFIDLHGYGREGAFALIKVSDTGTGIDDKDRVHLFEPFFTTKEVGKGTGLGLAIVYGIVKQHEGYIDVESGEGAGSTFTIYFPLIEQETTDLEESAAPAPSCGSETVLIGEDDWNVRELARTLLKEFGYRVIEAVDGMDAVEKFAANKEKIQLVILDVIMPKMNGKDAYEEMKKIKPDIKTLFLSGYTSDILTSKGILQDGLNFVIKPVLPGEFLNKVREVLGQ